MPPPTNQQRITLGQFADRFKNDMVPLGARFSYFCAAVSLSDDDLREYLQEPVAALPVKVSALLPPIQILLVPYLERNPGREKVVASQDLVVSVEKPADSRSTWAGTLLTQSLALLAFAVKDAEVADYHYRLYRSLAEIVSLKVLKTDGQPYLALLREELAAAVNGEVDELSWRAKQALLRRGSSRRETRLFEQYAQASFIDTLTLYLHGICCDIDVETGPRQLPSRCLRKRLKLLREMYPPPEGYAVFPEELPPGE